MRDASFVSARSRALARRPARRAAWLAAAAALLALGAGLPAGWVRPSAGAEPAAPPPAGEIRIGYVDLQRAIFASQAGKEARRVLDERTERLKKDFERREEELRRLRAEYLKQSAVLSPDARAEKERELQLKTRELQRLQQDYEDELNRKDAELSKRILSEVREIVRQVGGRGNYTLILEKNSAGVLYAASGVDLTDEVIRAYNASKGVR
ncbi:MAG TPA: OmpH family outer membrane protein [Thermodesulfobacteriota bacterium]|nr:OmpH family outer membrane protein [Thermodesulfobacteriota bacterium]